MTLPSICFLVYKIKHMYTLPVRNFINIGKPSERPILFCITKHLACWLSSICKCVTSSVMSLFDIIYKIVYIYIQLIYMYI